MGFVREIIRKVRFNISTVCVSSEVGLTEEEDAIERYNGMYGNNDNMLVSTKYVVCKKIVYETLSIRKGIKTCLRV